MSGTRWRMIHTSVYYHHHCHCCHDHSPMVTTQLWTHGPAVSGPVCTRQCRCSWRMAAVLSRTGLTEIVTWCHQHCLCQTNLSSLASEASRWPWLSYNTQTFFPWNKIFIVIVDISKTFQSFSPKVLFLPLQTQDTEVEINVRSWSRNWCVCWLIRYDINYNHATISRLITWASLLHLIQTHRNDLTLSLEPRITLSSSGSTSRPDHELDITNIFIVLLKFWC